MTDTPALIAARARATAAHAQLADAIGDLKDRLAPATIARNLAHDVAEKSTEVAQSGVAAVRARPVAAAGIAALAALFLARKPIVRALTRDSDETTALPARSAAEPRDRKAIR